MVAVVEGEVEHHLTHQVLGEEVEVLAYSPTQGEEGEGEEHPLMLVRGAQTLVGTSAD